MQSKGPGKKPGQGEDTYKLSGHGYNQAVYAVAQGLEHGSHDDAVSCEQEAEADNPQGRNADGQHLLVCLEEHEQLGRHKVEHHQSDEHDAHCNADAQPDRFHDALFTAGPVVVGYNGYHAVVQSEYRHEDKALKLEIYSEYGYGCLGKTNQDFIHPKGHDRADGLHDNRGNAYLVDNGNSSPVRGERTEINPHLLVFGVVQDEGQEHGHNLAEYSGCGSSLDSHFRHSKQAEDKNGVQYNIDDGPGALCNHTVKGLARGLENPLEHHFPKKPEAENADNLEILYAVFNDDRVVCLAFKEQPGSEQAEYCKGQEA